MADRPSRTYEDADDIGPGYRRVTERGIETLNVDTRAVHSGDVEDKGLSKDDLYARAQELDIEGRSQMSKDELEAAVRDAEGGA